ncbi:hypothetical protein CIB95_11830 [Lottiidibacillus patelloidae]|uniref:Uncharacterized protein n=1 Tax=Lottiidibacillus patelloidae TaxID=2670334 RepID=A0A263BSB4_9BACI|nr:hypothetical protein [Lottiidibacillus patelloidae]OZM56458.1 hypothetical protein CIB95_11830 [Lottiidibacillus patelloidae]
MSENKQLFVQFMHPGVEHKPNTGEKWNKSPHKRKFMRSKGRYIENGEVKEDLLQFWGEWEAQAFLIEQLSRSNTSEPEYLYEPYYSLPDSYEGLQNTDPFVFGENFYYTCCRQYKKYKGKFRSTSVRHLAPGSIILFGSRKNNDFILDTVFVVGENFTDYNSKNIVSDIKANVSQTYFETTILPLYPSLYTSDTADAQTQLSCNIPKERESDREEELYNGGLICSGDLSFRLYKGVSFSERDKYKGMYSFFPCKKYDDNSVGFARPSIKINDYITDNLSMGFKKTEIENEKAKDLWADVVKQVQAQGLCLGIYADLPKKN